MCTSELTFDVPQAQLSSVHGAVLPDGEPLAVGVTHTDSAGELAFSHAVLEATFARMFIRRSQFLLAARSSSVTLAGMGNGGVEFLVTKRSKNL